jgi:hypothetical protein
MDVCDAEDIHVCIGDEQPPRLPQRTLEELKTRVYSFLSQKSQSALKAGNTPAIRRMMCELEGMAKERCACGVIRRGQEFLRLLEDPFKVPRSRHFPGRPDVDIESKYEGVCRTGEPFLGYTIVDKDTSDVTGATLNLKEVTPLTPLPEAKFIVYLVHCETNTVMGILGCRASQEEILVEANMLATVYAGCPLNTSESFHGV